jgi:tetratricopeptide (TPR) repeat protein
MKQFFFFVFFIFFGGFAFAQTKPKPKPPTQSETDKMMNDAMKDMSPEDKAALKNMMGGVMTTMVGGGHIMAFYPEITSNKALLPKKNIAGINNIPKIKLTQPGMGNYVAGLYNKILTRGETAEIAIVKKIITQKNNPGDLGNAAVICMMQGHPQAAMALSMKAVMADPSNPNWQNNMASLLTQYGYPEQAIPVLQKLKTEFPFNSTVLNNLGQAWFDMGVLDSAKIYTSLAIRVNPFHPEAKVCGGLIEEINGDPIKATKDFTEAMENAPNPVIEKILKNKTGDNSLDKIDFEKLKRSITIYEYFPKDWIKIPQLSDNVSGYENDMRIQNGYAKMFEELKNKIETLGDASNAELNSLMEKGENDFAKTMAQESVKGINVMSKTAVTVQMILQIYLAKWTQDYVNENSALQQKIGAARAEMTKTADNDKCPDFDRKNNEFLAYANPLVREFHAKKIEEFRTWLNAFCTWSWYITGNPKNSIMTQCIGWTGALAGFYEDAIHDQEAIAKSCVNQNGDGKTFVPTPDIPNFSCPTIVSIPMGTDWQQLSSAVNNFDANSLGIKSNPSNTIPNQTMALGGSSKSIAQPGKDPFIQSSQGSVAPGMINSSDDELVPLPKLPNEDDLVPLPKIPLDELTPLPNIPSDELTSLPDLRRSKFLKDLLKKLMTADCKNVKSPKDKLKEQMDKMMKSVKELDAYEDLKNEFKKMSDAANEMEAAAEKKEQLKRDIEIMQQETEKMDKYESVEKSKNEIERIMKEMDAMDENKIFKSNQNKVRQLVDQMEETPSMINDIKINGLQPSISSGVQVPGTFTPQKGLFQ